MQRMSDTERKVAEWIWANPGIGTMQLVNMCCANFGWKRSTIFTLLKRMEEKGVLVKEESHFTMSIDRDAYYQDRIEDFLQEYCQSSFPRLVEMYLKNNGISKQEAGYVLNLVRTYTK